VLEPTIVEKRIVAAVLLVYFAFQANAALHHGSWGQDFSSHVKWILAARADPWHFATHPDLHGQEPPLFHLFGAAVVLVTHGRGAIETIAFLCIIANLLGLLMAYRLIRKLVENRILRLSCFMFITFLPVLMIHEVVLASDAFTLPIFLVMITLLTNLVESKFSAFWPRVLGISALLIAGAATKYTFGSQAVALFGIFCVLAFLKLIGKYRAFGSLLTIGIAGAITFAFVFSGAGYLGLQHKGWAMTWRDLVFLHARDVHVLRAPQYDELRHALKPGIRNAETETPRDQYELLTPGRYSYPALLHLAMFTDIMNIYQDDPTDSYFGQRTRTNQSRMRLGVKTGLIFSLLGAVLTPVALARIFHRTIIKQKEEDILRFILALCGLGWFLNIFLFLPSVPAYIGGFWLPRLILPALLTFIILSATELDRSLRRQPRQWSWAIMALVLLQSLINLSFLWPHGSVHPPLFS
jgi:hypothetical protein